MRVTPCRSITWRTPIWRTHCSGATLCADGPDICRQGVSMHASGCRTNVSRDAMSCPRVLPPCPTARSRAVSEAERHKKVRDAERLFSASSTTSHLSHDHAPADAKGLMMQYHDCDVLIVQSHMQQRRRRPRRSSWPSIPQRCDGAAFRVVVFPSFISSK